MISKLKSKLGIGKSAVASRDTLDSRIVDRKDSLKSAETSEVVPQSIQVSVGKSGYTASATVSDTKQPSPPRTPPPVVNVVTMEDSDEAMVTRERVGRVSNRLSKRAEMMRNQNGPQRTLLSSSRRVWSGRRSVMLRRPCRP